MPEQNKNVKPTWQGDKNPSEKILKLGQKITDCIPHKLKGLTSEDPEYWGLKELVSDEMADVALRMEVRVHYPFEEVLKLCPEYNERPEELKNLLEKMAYIGLLEFDYGDNFDHDGELKDRPRIKRYSLVPFVPGSAEFFNMRVKDIKAHPSNASFFERMTFIPLTNVTPMVPEGGDGIGMKVIPVEKAIQQESKSIDIEHISYWLKKYDGHFAAGLCSCRASRSELKEGCGDDPDDWCIGVGDMADYLVETDKGRYVTKE